MTTTATTEEGSPTIYFAYGSNLWLAQMRQRCPTSTYLGVARLSGWRWIIHQRGYANIVQLPSPAIPTIESSSTIDDTPASETDYSRTVFGMLYTLSPSDEASLDRYEGVPESYTKEYLTVDFWPSSQSTQEVDIAALNTPEKKEVLVYVDRLRVTEGPPRAEYVRRMNRAIEDALSVGVPRGYVDTVMRKSIPRDS